MRAERREDVRARQLKRCFRPTQGCVGGRARAERTRNMRCMFMTLDVSKLSGWLKAVACCRVRGRVYGVAVVVAQAAHRTAGARLCGPQG